MAGSRGMIQLPGEASTQMVLSVGFDQWQEAGTVIALRDSTGAMLAEFAPEKEFQWILVSTPDMEEGAQVTLSAGGTDTLTTTLSQVITSLAQDGRLFSSREAGCPWGILPPGQKDFSPGRQGRKDLTKEQEVRSRRQSNKTSWALLPGILRDGPEAAKHHRDIISSSKKEKSPGGPPSSFLHPEHRFGAAFPPFSGASGPGGKKRCGYRNDGDDR